LDCRPINFEHPLQEKVFEIQFVPTKKRGLKMNARPNSSRSSKPKRAEKDQDQKVQTEETKRRLVRSTSKQPANEKKRITMEQNFCRLQRA
jgi:hypothetical protein